MQCRSQLGLALLIVGFPPPLLADLEEGGADAMLRALENPEDGTGQLLAYTIDRACAAAATHEPPRSAEEWEQRAPLVHDALLASLGQASFAPREGLKAQVVGRSQGDGYTLENITFESRPGFVVTANLYIPDGLTDPAPAVLFVPGHAMAEGKNYGYYATQCASLARLGFVVLAYDPIGQGERQVSGNEHNVGFAALMVGMTNEGFICHESQCALDYLCSRLEVDPARIGLTGNSGGGTNTFYLAAIEPRIAAAVPNCFVCSYEQFLRYGGVHCICNHIAGILPYAEQWGIAGLIAPRPLLIGSGTQDPIFPIAGTRDTYAASRALYGLLGAEDNVRLFEVDAGHGLCKELREATCGWFLKNLAGVGDGSPVPEPEDVFLFTPDSPEALCFDEGHIPEDGVTYADIVREEGRRLVVQRLALEPSRLRDDIRRLLALPEDLGGASATPVGEPTSLGDVTIERLLLETEPGFSIPAVWLRPTGETGGRTAVFCAEDGKAVALEHPVVKALLDAGRVVLAIDVRGTGELACDLHQPVTDGILLGEPVFGGIVRDVLQAAAYAESIAGRAPALLGEGALGSLAVLHAACLRPQTAAVALNGVASYLDTFAPLPTESLAIYVPGILTVCDVPNLAEACQGRVLVAGAHGSEASLDRLVETGAVSDDAESGALPAAVLRFLDGIEK